MELPEGTVPSHWKTTFVQTLSSSGLSHPAPHLGISPLRNSEIYTRVYHSLPTPVHGHVHTSADVYRDLHTYTSISIQTHMYKCEYRYPGCPCTHSHSGPQSHPHTAACTCEYTHHSACHTDVSSDASRSYLLPVWEWMFSLAAFRWVPGSAQAWKCLHKSIFAAVNY